MIFYKLFAWLDHQEDAPLYCLIDHADLDLEKQNAIDQHKKSLADQRISIFARQDIVRPNDLEIQRDLLKFLEFCDKEIDYTSQYSPAILLLKYFLSSSTFDNEKIIELFSYFLQQDSINAINFYPEIVSILDSQILLNHLSAESFLENYSQLKVKLATLVTEHYLNYFTQKLQLQASPQGIVGLIHLYSDRVEEFAALILWLLERGLNTEEILQSGLLQQFMMYNVSFASLSSENSIKFLYEILNEFSSSTTLVTTASQVHCQERGFENYLINGSLASENADEILEDQHLEIEISPAISNFTPLIDNFISLYEVFGSPFLKEVANWSFVNAGITDKNELSIFFDNVKIDDLATLINYFGFEDDERYLKNLSFLLSDEILKKLVVNNSGAILHILSEHKKFSREITKTHAESFIDDIKRNNIEFNKIYNRLNQIFATALPNPPISFLYEHFLDYVLLSSPNFNYENLFINCRSFAGIEEILINKSQEIHREYLNCLIEQTSTHHFTLDNYIDIERVRNFAAIQQAFLTAILPLYSSLNFKALPDIYTMQAHIVKLLKLQHVEDFDIREFFAVLEIEPILDENVVNQYEQLARKLLLVVDDEEIREVIIHQFKNKYPANDFRPLLPLAAREGNIGMMSWMTTNFTFKQKYIIQALESAIDSEQWDSIKFFCNLDFSVFNRLIRERILELAAHNQRWDYLTILFTDDGEHNHFPRPHIVNKCFLLAISQERIDVLNTFKSLEIISDDTIVIGFKQAINANAYALLEVLGDLRSNKLLVHVIEEEALKAIDNNNYILFKILLSFNDYPVNEIFREKALKKAYEAEQLEIVSYLEASKKINYTSHFFINSDEEKINSTDNINLQYSP